MTLNYIETRIARLSLRYFTRRQAVMLAVLSDLIIPPDEISGGGVSAGCVEFLDLVVSSDSGLQAEFTKGLDWLDAAMAAQFQTDFLSAQEVERRAILDSIAYGILATWGVPGCRPSMGAVTRLSVRLLRGVS